MTWLKAAILVVTFRDLLPQKKHSPIVYWLVGLSFRGWNIYEITSLLNFKAVCFSLDSNVFSECKKDFIGQTFFLWRCFFGGSGGFSKKPSSYMKYSDSGWVSPYVTLLNLLKTNVFFLRRGTVKVFQYPTSQKNFVRWRMNMMNGFHVSAVNSEPEIEIRVI